MGKSFKFGQNTRFWNVQSNWYEYFAEIDLFLLYVSDIPKSETEKF